MVRETSDTVKIPLLVCEKLDILSPEIVLIPLSVFNNVLLILIFYCYAVGS